MASLGERRREARPGRSPHDPSDRSDPSDPAERTDHGRGPGALPATHRVDARRVPASQNEKEHRLLLKTVPERRQAVEAAVRELHSYELPAIHAVALDEVHPPYAAWIEANATGGTGDPRR